MRIEPSVLSLFVSVLLAFPLFADASRLFLLRSKDRSEQGIFAIGPDRSLRVVAPFVYRQYELHEPPVHLNLTATSDRLILQGRSFYEFDLSGQLLRRYPALGPEFDTWSMHGVVLDEQTGKTLGIASGTYGFLSCRGQMLCPNARSIPGGGNPLAMVRRGLEPGDTAVQLIKTLEAGGAVQRPPFISLDEVQSRFWFSTPLSTETVRVSFAPVGLGTVGEEVVVRTDPAGALAPPALQGQQTAFLHDLQTGNLLAAYHQVKGSEENRLVELSFGGGTVLMRESGSARWDAMTRLSALEPSHWTQTIPAAANTAGANGTHWSSDGWLFNPSDQEMLVRLWALSAAEQPLELRIRAKGSIRIQNVLSRLQARQAIDAVVVQAPYRRGQQLSVVSRTYTESQAGSFGQAVPAVPTLAGYSNHARSVDEHGDIWDAESELLLDRREGRFRHNFGVVNTGESPIEIRLSYGRVRDPDFTRTVTVGPQSLKQVNIETLFSSDMFQAVPPRVRVTGDRPAILYLSIVDNETGDASFIPFSNFDLEPDGDARLAIPAIAHLPGANGTWWRSDLYGIFAARDGFLQQPKGHFYPSSESGCSAKQWRLSGETPAFVNGGTVSHTLFQDVARQACPEQAASRGALEVQAGSWMAAYSRTYTSTPSGGTFGEILPLYPPRGWPVRHFAGLDLHRGVRINLGLFNGEEVPVAIDLSLYDEDGSLTAHQTIELSPKDSRQFEMRALFGAELPDGLYGLSVLPRDGRGCWPYVSVVDGGTGDPTNWW